MAWYNGTYSCGHEGRVNIIGPGKDRKWKRERYFSGLCPECEKKRCEEVFEKRNAESAEKAAEMELPELDGTQKQVAWANTIRQEKIDYIDEKSDRNGRITFFDLDVPLRTEKEELLLALENGLKEHRDAKFWIDNRFGNDEIAIILLKEYRDMIKNQIPESVQEEIEQEEEQLTVRPENASKDGVVLLKKLSETKLGVKYVKDEDFRKVVKRNSFEWDWDKSCWTKEITEYTGTFDDRAAEIGNLLLANGFTVRFLSRTQLDMAVSGLYIPECKRWIKYSEKKKALLISWEGNNNTVYMAAKKLSGARWDGRMYVPVSSYKQVEDFAETLEFTISESARAAIQKYKEEEDSYLVVGVRVPEQEGISDEERLKKSLETDGTIIEDLIDET